MITTQQVVNIVVGVSPSPALSERGRRVYRHEVATLRLYYGDGTNRSLEELALHLHSIDMTVRGGAVADDVREALSAFLTVCEASLSRLGVRRRIESMEVAS